MSKLRIAINGFGRIGRQFFKIAFDQPEIEVVVINDLGDVKNMAYLLEWDSVYGHYDKKIEAGEDYLTVNDQKIKFLNEPEPSKLPWSDLDIDIVVESTGRFTSYEKAKPHLDAGAKRVVLSAPAKDDGNSSTGSTGSLQASSEQAVTATPNINEEVLAQSKITSNASCTTNAITPLAAIMIVNPGIKAAIISTVHGYTAEQNLVDGPMPVLHKDLRRGRNAAQNIVPTTTGATTAAAKAVPGMQDKFDGIALRVPIAAGSLLDFTFISERKTSAEEINKIFSEEAAKPAWQGILTVTDQPLVSSDIIGNPHGAIVDLGLTKVISGELVKVMAWYDNEWGYASMLLKHVLSLRLLT